MFAERTISPPVGPTADPRHDRVDATGWNLVHTATMAVWTGCLTLGILGSVFKYPRPHLAVKAPPPIVAEHVQVALADDPTLIDSQAAATPIPQTPLPQPPAPAEAQIPSDAPPLTPVANPSPAIAFALPVASPAQVVDAKQAVPIRAPAQPATPSPGAVHHLTYGVGEGAQPSPEYPRAAILANQQGTVGIRFTVGTDGKVTSAQVSSECQWPILNQAAVRVVHDRWRFNPGPVRYFDVSIQFELTEQ